jgi:hypothetical protein
MWVATGALAHQEMANKTVVAGSNSNIHLALVHFPVYNKTGDIVTSSVTTLDVHDIARICRTFALGTFYVVTPLKAQQELVRRLLQHWVSGFGAEYNPTRKEALHLASVTNLLQDAVADITTRTGKKPQTIVTDAKPFPQSVGYEAMRSALSPEEQYLIIFGTGWGLDKGVVRKADHVLEPIYGVGTYNHLPVRAAIAVILDRLFAPRY